MKFVTLPSGERVPAFGIGTWAMAESSAARPEEIATIRLALDRGAALIDTAEMYGDGRVEALVGDAIKGRREDAFLVTKVYPHNATRRGTAAACERSLKRLGTDRIDLYLLHWRGEVPLAQTLDALVELREKGKIRYFGVSNLDLSDLKELWELPGGSQIQTNQLLYNLGRRGIEKNVLPWQRERRIPVMAYSPLEQARLLANRKLVDFARRRGSTPARAALGWLLAHDDVIVIPKSGRRDRLEENLAAIDHPLDAAALAELDRLFPAPPRPIPLEMI